MEKTGWQRVMPIDEIPQEQLWSFHVGEHPLIVIRRGQQCYVYEDLCSHADYPLSFGQLEADQIICSWHGACFALATGQALDGPTNKPITKIPSQIINQTLYVYLPKSAKLS